MATKVQGNDQLPLDPEDELTRPEARPALRAAHTVPDALGESPSGVGALPPDLVPQLAPPAADDDDEVTQVDTHRRRLVSAEGLPPPPDFPDLE